MKLALGIFLALLTIGSVQASTFYTVDDDMYFQKLDNTWGNLGYQVDKVAQLCFVIWKASANNAGGIATIPCESLAKRPEWKPIITWVK